MNEQQVVLLSEWPQPETGAPMPMILADECSLFVRYYTQMDKIAVVHFPLYYVFTFGAPNDEALHGHPLYEHGLQFYSVHRVENSAWIALLELRNSVHPSHNKQLFLEGKKHYVFTFHDSLLECVVTEGENGLTEFAEFDSHDDAKKYIAEKQRAN